MSIGKWALSILTCEWAATRSAESSNGDADYPVHPLLPKNALKQKAIPGAAIPDSTNHFSRVYTLGESEFDLAGCVEGF